MGIVEVGIEVVAFLHEADAARVQIVVGNQAMDSGNLFDGLHNRGFLEPINNLLQNGRVAVHLHGYVFPLAKVLLQDHLVLGRKGGIDALGQSWVQEIVDQKKPRQAPSAKLASEARSEEHTSE